jgi:hypothetical protein
MQEQFKSAQESLSSAEAIGTAGGGLVSATVTGTGELVDLTLDPSIVDPADVETLSDLIIAAVRDAHAEIQRKATEQFGAIDADVANLLAGGDDQAAPLADFLGGPSTQAHVTSEGEQGRGDQNSGETSPGQQS